MKTNDISDNIKTALQTNINRKAPAGLHLHIMQHVRKEQPQIVPPSTNWLLLLGMAVALGAILFPFLVDENSVEAAATNFNLPQVAFQPAFWYSLMAVALLFAADVFFGAARLKHQLK